MSKNQALNSVVGQFICLPFCLHQDQFPEYET
jgi:hypothetical protein